MSDAHTLDRLFAVIESRKGADPSSSYTASLFARGTAKIAQKVGEEAVETVIEGMRGDQKLLVSESADLLYHLCVLWADQGVTPDQIWAELASRAKPDPA
ncbi:MAG: phosphoribosyl-ATP diphosphatase [Alphaproteobacteria bacterium]|jgi:phosphoribosyl-ATP pyrophosphohydrolase